MMDRDEALSRLLAGDLPGADAEVWRERIATDPEVARAWATMNELARELDALPLEVPPAALDARVVGRRGRPWLPWLLAAVVLLAIGLAWPPERAVVTLGPGVHRVDGTVRVVAGAVIVDVDGVARVTVEPAAAPVREPPTGGDVRATIGAGVGALVGAAVTIAVLEGSAEVVSGESTTVEIGGPPATPAPRRRPADRPDRDLERAKARITELEAEIVGLRRDLDIANGQLTTHRGTVQDWPEDVHPASMPEAMRARMDRVFGPLAGDGVSTDLDCGEFPCVIVAKGPAGLDVPQLVGGLSDGLDNPAVLLSQQQINYDDGPIEIVAFAVIVDELDAFAYTRVEYRLATLADAAL